ncbi:MAG TPA: pilus assembly protein N-terminal domain-containing protein [Xanthobacteraceae bacterium]|nr:pilus assembly protein N-terminal domain-containing protein [Xanthobacteraceae bacterium]
MCAAFRRIGRTGRPAVFAGLLLGFALLTAGFPCAAAGRDATASETVTVLLDQAKVMKLPDRIATLVIGNPLIADVSIQKGGMIVITGKGYGVTNLVALDDGGELLTQKTIRVEGPREGTVVYRGIDRETYSCTPKCERRITLGDGTQYFNDTISQIGARAGQAQGAAASSSSAPR